MTYRTYGEHPMTHADSMLRDLLISRHIFCPVSGYILHPSTTALVQAPGCRPAVCHVHVIDDTIKILQDLGVEGVTVTVAPSSGG